MKTWGMLVVVIAGCAPPAVYELESQETCDPAEGTVDTWCTDEGACEYRVGDEVVSSCAGDVAECRTAFDAAHATCVEQDLCTPTNDVDLLFVIDDSHGMDLEQAQLIEALPAMVRGIAPASLHVGVVSTDMGAGPVPSGESVPGCEPGFGDDGILRREGCGNTYPSRIFEYSGMGEDTTLLDALGCVANVGTSGCGFEQQLEAGLKALSPADSALTFSDGGFPHGDGENGGFLRAGSVLAIVVLTSEDDCSRPDDRLVYMNDPAYAGVRSGLRCTHFPDALYSIDRYVDGYLRLRHRPSRLVFGAIAGLPHDLAGASYETLLADSRMQIVEHPGDGHSLDPACEGEVGVAYPGRRIVEVARGLRDGNAHSSVSSICADSYDDGLAVIVADIRAALACP
jgi:hypothetical protein